MTLARLLHRDGLADLERTFTAYRALRAGRTRAIQLSAKATSDALHLHDGADLAGRDARLARFPAEFGRIHGFDLHRALDAGPGRLREMGA